MSNMSRPLIALCALTLLVSCSRKDMPEPRATPISQKVALQEEAPWGKAKAGFQCSITCSSLDVSSSKPADLFLRVRNNGNTALHYHLRNCDGPTYQIQGSWPNGAALVFSDLEQQEHHPCGVTNWIALGVGETNKHIISIKAGTFLGDEYLFVGPEFGSPIEQYGILTMKLSLMDIESNPIHLDIKKVTP